MSNKFKDICTKSHTYCFFNDIIHVRNFDTSSTKIGEKSYKNIFYLLNWICNNERFKISKNSSVHLLYLIFSKMNRYFEFINKSKYFILVPTNEGK